MKTLLFVLPFPLAIQTWAYLSLYILISYLYGDKMSN